jgi:hypothetical protein
LLGHTAARIVQDRELKVSFGNREADLRGILILPGGDGYEPKLRVLLDETVEITVISLAVGTGLGPKKHDQPSFPFQEEL